MQLLYQVVIKIVCPNWKFLLPWRNSPSGPGPPRCLEFMITLRHTTLGRTYLDKWSARRRDLYLTTHNIHKRQTFMPPAGFEPTILASERPHTQVLDRAATGIGLIESLDFWIRPDKCFNINGIETALRCCKISHCHLNVMNCDAENRQCILPT
jgi:hypothetical protein